MTMDPLAVFALIFAFALVFLNGFFVAAEFAIVKVRPTQVAQMVKERRPGADSVQKVVHDLNPYLSATQLGITLASLGLGSIGEPAFEQLIAPVIEPVVHMMGFSETTAKTLNHGLIFTIIMVLHVVVGELAPKTLAIVRAESVATAVAFPLRFFYVIFFPLIYLLNALADLLLRAFGIQSEGHGHGGVHSEEEVKMILGQAQTSGWLSDERGELLQKAISLPSKTARYLMVPRNDVVFLDVHLPMKENLARAMSSDHSRFPLCERVLDEVIGIVDIRQVLFAMGIKVEDPTATVAAEDDGDSQSLREHALEAHYYPESVSAERLLKEFRDNQVRMAVIVDEYGGASGIVTPADVVTAVMGEFDDEGEEEWVALPGGAYDVEGTTPLEEVAETLKITIESEDMRTVAGFVMERLGRMPQAGDRVHVERFIFEVREVVGPRVRRIRIQRDSAGPKTLDSLPPPSTTPIA